MHEWGLAQELVRACAEEAFHRGATKVISASVRVGSLTAVVPELLERAFEVARKESPLLGDATLLVEVEAVRGKCGECQHECTFVDFFIVCPSCGGSRVAILSGDDIALAKMELEMDGPAEAHGGEGHV